MGRTLRVALAVALTTLAWTGGQYVGLFVVRGSLAGFFKLIGWPGGWLTVGQFVMWAVGGLGTGLALRLAIPTLQWRRVFIIATGWLLIGPLRVRVPALVGYTLYDLQLQQTLMKPDFGVHIGPAIGGLITILAVRRGQRTLDWWRVIAITIGWGLGLTAIQKIVFYSIGTSGMMRVLPGVAIGSGLASLLMYGLLDRTLRSPGELRETPVSTVGMLRSNPLIKQLTRRGGWTSSTAALAVMMAIVVAGTAIGLGWYTSMQQVNVTFSSGLLLLALTIATTMLPPPILAFVAVTLTIAQARDRRLELLRVTGLSAGHVVWGLLLGALHRARILLVIALGVMPPAFAALLNFYVMNFSTVFPGPTSVLPGESLPAVGPALTSAALAIGLLGMNLLAVALGVALALRWPERNVTAILALLLMPIIIMAALAVAVGGFTFIRPQWIARAIGLVFFALVPYVIGSELVETARRSVQSLYN